MMKYPFLSEIAFRAPWGDMAVITASAMGFPLSSVTVPWMVPVEISQENANNIKHARVVRRHTKQRLRLVIKPPLNRFRCRGMGSGVVRWRPSGGRESVGQAISSGAELPINESLPAFPTRPRMGEGLEQLIPI